jgi:hypothetical protein
MALPLNVYKTVTTVVPTSNVAIYTAPVGYSSVILLAQAANIDTNTHTISFSHERTTVGIAVTTEILKDFPIEGNDTATLLGGKLVLESGDSLTISASDGTNIKFIGSILETLN